MYEITEEQIGKLLVYLSNCRYKEVFQLIGMLQTLKPIEKKAEEPDD